MADKKPARPRQSKAGKASGTTSFQARVDYIAKALVRGSWGPKFDACFEQHDSNHVIAVVMLRAERNDRLRSAIIERFDVASWEDVPWQEIVRNFAGHSAKKIRELAEQARQDNARLFKELFADPEKILEDIQET